VIAILGADSIIFLIVANQEMSVQVTILFMTENSCANVDYGLSAFSPM
jgi:hypothetical protein